MNVIVVSLVGSVVLAFVLVTAIITIGMVFLFIACLNREEDCESKRSGREDVDHVVKAHEIVIDGENVEDEKEAETFKDEEISSLSDKDDKKKEIDEVVATAQDDEVIDEEIIEKEEVGTDESFSSSEEEISCIKEKNVTPEEEYSSSDDDFDDDSDDDSDDDCVRKVSQKKKDEILMENLKNGVYDFTPVDAGCTLMKHSRFYKQIQESNRSLLLVRGESTLHSERLRPFLKEHGKEVERIERRNVKRMEKIYKAKKLEKRIRRRKERMMKWDKEEILKIPTKVVF